MCASLHSLSLSPCEGPRALSPSALPLAGRESPADCRRRPCSGSSVFWGLLRWAAEGPRPRAGLCLPPFPGRRWQCLPVSQAAYTLPLPLLSPKRLASRLEICSFVLFHFPCFSSVIPMRRRKLLPSVFRPEVRPPLFHPVCFSIVQGVVVWGVCLFV